MTEPTTRAERMAQPTARDAVRAVAENHGACLRPIQLRRTNTQTGQVDQVLVPCGATLADICPPCAERAKQLRAAQCRDGWHLDTEPIPSAPPLDEVQAMWVEHRAQAQADRDHAAQAGDDTTELDELITDLDREIKRSGLRGNADPSRPRPRRQRSTRRRQDTPDLPKRKISPHTVGKTYTAPDGKIFRPSMFLTLTCPSYGKVGEDGTPADPGSYGYQRAARDALHFAALFDRFIQTCAASTCANWLRYGIQPKNPRLGLVPGACKGKAHRRDHLGYAGRRVLVSRRWSGKTLADHRSDRKAWLIEMLGLPATEPATYWWEPVQPGDEDYMPPSRRLLHAVADRLHWQNALTEARRRARDALASEISATGRAA